MQIIQRASQFSKGVTGNVSALIRSAFRCAPLSISDADIAPNMKRAMTKTTRRISTALSVLDELLLYVAKAIHYHGYAPKEYGQAHLVGLPAFYQQFSKVGPKAVKAEIIVHAAHCCSVSFFERMPCSAIILEVALPTEKRLRTRSPHMRLHVVPPRNKATMLPRVVNYPTLHGKSISTLHAKWAHSSLAQGLSVHGRHAILTPSVTARLQFDGLSAHVRHAIPTPSCVLRPSLPT